jgi:hypothetical protein
METTTQAAGVPLSSDLGDPEAIPYFLWDDPMPMREVCRRLRTSSHAEKIHLLAKIMREAKDTEVWLFTSPAEVALLWAELSPQLGRRRSFWEFLLATWQRQGRIVLEPSR